MTMIPPTHCTKCGRVLVERRSFTGLRSQLTGQKTYYTERVCPRLIGPFAWLIGLYHSSFHLHEGSRFVWHEGQWA